MDKARFQHFSRLSKRVKAFDSLPSANTLAMEWAREDAPHGSVVLADSQTVGRGRQGRVFFSPSGGLYLSLIVDSGGISPGLLTTLAAVAVCEAITGKLGLHPQIKWVNDILLDGKKVGGILTEGVVIGNQLSRAVIGIGLNLGEPDFPEDLRDTAGSLYTPGRHIDRERLAARVVDGILEKLPLAPAHLDAYRALCATLKQPVRLEQGGRVLEGMAEDIGPDGSLLVSTPEGLSRVLSGDVSLLKPSE